MMRKFCLVALIASLAGCGGLEISSLTIDEAKNAHESVSDKSVSDKKVPDYIVYHPMIVVEVKREYNIQERSIKCVMGKPQTLPDYSKPFLLRLKPGIGKSSVDLKIEDGWRLDGIKSEADNTAWIKDIVKQISIPKSQEGKESQGKELQDNTCASGLYQLSIDDSKKMKLRRIEIDVSP